MCSVLHFWYTCVCVHTRVCVDDGGGKDATEQAPDIYLATMGIIPILLGKNIEIQENNEMPESETRADN